MKVLSAIIGVSMLATLGACGPNSQVTTNDVAQTVIPAVIGYQVGKYVEKKEAEEDKERREREWRERRDRDRDWDRRDRDCRDDRHRCRR